MIIAISNLYGWTSSCLRELKHLGNEEKNMRRLWDIEIRSGDRPLLPHPETGQSVDSQEDDRSPATVLRQTIRSIAGLPFFVVAALLLLHGPSLMRFL
jgi:hypothetical protein